MTTPSTAPSRLRDWFSWLCINTPLLLLLGLLTLALHVRLGLGRWPVPVIENYQTASYLLHEYFVCTWLLITVTGSLPAWALLLCFQIGNNRGGINDWVGPNCIYGRTTKVET